MEYTTRANIKLQIGRIPRERIDRFVVGKPPPEPPTRTVEVFGDVEEEVPIRDDPTYLRELGEYYWQLGDQQIELITDAVELSDSAAGWAELRELELLGAADSCGKADLLRHVVLGDRVDLIAVVALVFYQSTATERGIAEATEAFNVRWSGQPLSAWHVPGTPGRYGPAFEARRAAQFAYIKWADFSALPGLEQSAIVAFYRLSAHLDYLAMKHRKGGR